MSSLEDHEAEQATITAAHEAGHDPHELPDGDYVLVEGSAWFTVKNASVRIHATDEGVCVDIFRLDDEMSEAVGSTWVLDSQLEPDEL